MRVVPTVVVGRWHSFVAVTNPLAVEAKPFAANPTCARPTTPLSGASVGGHEEMVSFLVSKGADVNRKNRLTGGIPLIVAAEMGHCKCLASCGPLSTAE